MRPTAAELAAAVAQTRSSAPSAVHAEDLAELLAETSEALTLDADAALYVLALLCRRLRRAIASTLAALDALTSAIGLLPLRPVVAATEGVAVFASRLADLRDAPPYARQRAARLAVAAGGDAVRGLGCAVAGDLHPSDAEVYASVRAALTDAATHWADVQALQTYVDGVLPQYTEVYAAAAQRHATRGAEVVAALPRAPPPRATAITLLSVRSGLGALAGCQDPLSSKGAAVITATGAFTRARTPLGTLSAPFSVPAEGALFTPEVDGVARPFYVPGSAPAILLTGAVPALGLSGGGTIDIALLGDATVTTVTIPSGADAADIAALFAAVPGVTATVQATYYVQIATEEVGSRAGLVVSTTTGGAGAALGLVAGVQAQGRDSSLAELLSNAPSGVQIQAPVVIRRAIAATGVAGEARFIVDSTQDMQAGDVLSLRETSTVWAFRIVSVLDATTVETDRAWYEGDFVGHHVRQPLLLLSGTDGASSSVTVPDDVGAGVLGLLPGTYVGQARAVLATPAPRRPVRAGDVLRGSEGDLSVAAVNGSVLSVAEVPVTLERSVAIVPQGAAHYDSLLAAVLQFRQTVLQGSFARGLQPLADRALSVVARRTGRATAGPLVDELTAALSALLAGVEDYAAARVPVVDQLLAAYKERGYDRAYDLLATGQLAALFATTAVTATWRGAAQTSAASTAQEFPLPAGVDLIDVVEAAEQDTAPDPQYSVERDQSAAGAALADADDADSDVVY